MSIEIKIRKNEPIDRALRRMKKKLDRENIIKGTRAKRYYEKPCEKRRRKDKAVSYTHLDVYKRQLVESAGAGVTTPQRSKKPPLLHVKKPRPTGSWRGLRGGCGSLSCRSGGAASR